MPPSGSLSNDATHLQIMSLLKTTLLFTLSQFFRITAATYDDVIETCLTWTMKEKYSTCEKLRKAI